MCDVTQGNAHQRKNVNEKTMIRNNRCPRCDFPSYEALKTHSFCWECGFAPVLGSSKDLRGRFRKRFRRGSDPLDLCEFFDLPEEQRLSVYSRLAQAF